MRATTTLRVAVVTEDRLLREGLSCLLTADAAEVVAADSSPAHGEAFPEIVLLDSRREGAFATCEALRHSMRAMVILIGAPDDEEWALEALASGARGILTLRAGRDELLAAMEAARQGQIWAPRRVIVARLDQLAEGSPPPPAASELEQRLSLREREIFRQAAAGLGNKELADRLSISQATVKVHLTHIFQKLGLSGRAELAAAYHGLLPPKHTRPRGLAAAPPIEPGEHRSETAIRPKA